MSDPNTRKEKRTPVTLKIKFKSATLDQFIERYSVDVSHGGIFIRTKDPLAVGTQLRFEFQLQDASPLISGEGTVVWTREHDPARVGVAPGMGVRFDKLAAESQAVLDKILAMKSKEGGGDSAKFDAMAAAAAMDPKTKVAPAPLVSGLQAQSAEKTRVAPSPTGPPPAGSPRSTVMGLGPQLAVPPSGTAPTAVGKGHSGPGSGKANTVPANKGGVGALTPSRGGFPDEPSRDATPLPKPMPFSSVDDDFSEEAFNQPTRVAGSFEDLLRKAEQEAAANEGKGPAAAAAAAAAATPVVAEPKSAPPALAGSNGAAKGSGEQPAANDAAMEAAAAEKKAAEIRAAEENEIRVAAEKKAAAEKRAAEERAAEQRAAEEKAARRASAERAAEAARPAAARASGAHATLPSVDYREKKKRSPAVLVVGVLVVAGGAAAFALVNRNKQETAENPPAATDPAAPGTATPTPPVEPPPAPVAAATADAAPVAPPVPKGIEVQVVSTPAGATVLHDGKSVGVTPLALPGLEEGKSYDLVLQLACYTDAKVSVDASKEKASDLKVDATLKPLPRVVRIDTEPKGGSIYIDGSNTGKQSPADVPLAGKFDPTKPHKVTIKKNGFQPGETEIAPDATCTAENGKGVLLAQVTLAEVPKAAPVPVEKKEPKVKKPKEPKEPPAPDDGTPPTGLMPKDPNAPKEPATTPAPTPTPAPAPTPAEKKPEEKPAEKTPPNEEPEHTPDWMKEQ